MSVSNSSIDPSFIFVGAEKPQVLKTTDTHFGNFPSISTPTFPIDSSSSSSAPSQLVTDHATSPVRLSLSCLEPTSPDQPLFRRPRLCRRLQFVIPSTTGLVVKLAEFALTNFVDMVWPCVTSVVSTSRSYIRCVVFALHYHTTLNSPIQSPFPHNLGGRRTRRSVPFLSFIYSKICISWHYHISHLSNLLAILLLLTQYGLTASSHCARTSGHATPLVRRTSMDA